MGEAGGLGDREVEAVLEGDTPLGRLAVGEALCEEVAERVEETMVAETEVAMAGAARVVEMGEGAKAAGKEVALAGQ